MNDVTDNQLGDGTSVWQEVNNVEKKNLDEGATKLVKYLNEGWTTKLVEELNEGGTIVVIWDSVEGRITNFNQEEDMGLGCNHEGDGGLDSN